jgi:hypothetical protein
MLKDVGLSLVLRRGVKISEPSEPTYPKKLDDLPPLSEEQLKELEKMENTSITYDEDCPESTPEMLKSFAVPARQRDRLRNYYGKIIHRILEIWDPDFTKLTPSEAAELRAIIKEMDGGICVKEDDIDWD